MSIRQWAAAAAAASVLAMSPAQAAPEVTWKMPAAVPEGSFFYENFMERFAGHVETLTEGRMRIQPFGAGVVVPAFKIYEAVQDGTVEAGHTTPSFIVNQDPTNAIFASFPGGMSPNATVHWIYEQGGEQMLQDFRREEMGLHSLVVGIGTSEVLAHAHEPVTEAEDLKKLKYRTSGAWAQVLKDHFDGVPTVVPPGEIYTLLQRKGVDAVEWATPGSNLPEGFHNIAEYVVIPGIHQPTFLWEVVIKQETWESLPADLKPLVERAAKLTTLESMLHFGDEDIQAMDAYRDNGNQIVELSPELLEQVRDAGHEWVREQAKARASEDGGRMQEILDSYLDYQALWSKNSDYLVRD